MAITDKESTIWLQVVLKEWCAINGRLPKNGEWREIIDCAKNIWKNSLIVKQEIDEAGADSKRSPAERKFINELNKT